MTTTTKTTASPSKFQVGDFVTWEAENNKWWHGGKGEVISLSSTKDPKWVVVEVMEPVPGNESNSPVGAFIDEYPHNLKLSEDPKPAEEDVVNSPSHYTQYPVEVIELTRHMPFDDGNVVKYVARSPFKGNRLQDLKKARWYLDDAIAEEEKKLEAAK